MITVFAFTAGVLGQDGVPTIKAEVMSALVWGEDSPSGALSSTIRDPLTGNTIRTLSYAGIEVSSRIGFEGVGTDEARTFLNYTTTIVNSTGQRYQCDTVESVLMGTRYYLSRLRPLARTSVRRNAKANQMWWS